MKGEQRRSAKEKERGGALDNIEGRGTNYQLTTRKKGVTLGLGESSSEEKQGGNAGS